MNLILVVSALSFIVTVQSIFIDCPNTQLYVESDPKILALIHRKFINDVWSSSIIPRVSLTAGRFIDDILGYAQLDSSVVLYNIYLFSSWMAIYVPNFRNELSYCLPTAVTNASLVWSKTRNGAAVLQSFDLLKQLIDPICGQIRSNFLLRSDCPNIQPQTIEEAPCYDKGGVYDIEDALKTYGKYIPDHFKTSLRILYKSTRYSDRVICAVFVFSLTEAAIDLYEMLIPANFIELFYFVINTKTSEQCCQQHSDRFVQLCPNISIDVSKSIAELKNSKYQAYTCVKN